MSWLSSMFGGGHGGQGTTNPATGAMNYLDQIPGQYTNPDMYNQIAGQYKQSPGYQEKLRTAMMAGNNAAAAGGMLGSNQHQFMNAHEAEGLADEDFQNYWNRRMGLNQDMGSLMGSKAQYSYNGQAGLNQEHANKINQILQLIGSLGGGALGWLNNRNNNQNNNQNSGGY